MGRMVVGILCEDVQTYRDAARRLRAAGRHDLRKKVQQSIRATGQPILDEVRAAVLNTPSTSHGGGKAKRREFHVATTQKRVAKAGKTGEKVAKSVTAAARRNFGLRQSIARATKLEVTARGVRFVVRSEQLPEDQRNLPGALDTEKGWRHPVFGKRPIVKQRGHPYFRSRIKAKAPGFRAGILRAMDETIREIEG
jgi:hypothetical protein